MSKTKNSYNTRKDIISRQIFQKNEMVRLVVINHVIYVSNDRKNKGYWVKKSEHNFNLLNDKKHLCKLFKDHLVTINNLDELKSAMLN